MGNAKQLDIEVQELIKKLHLPEYITALQAVAFDSVTLVKELLSDDYGCEPDDLTVDDVISLATELSWELLHNSTVEPKVFSAHPLELLDNINDSDYITYKSDIVE